MTNKETLIAVIIIAICSLLIALCFLIAKKTKQKLYAEFDERQLIARNKAMINAFFTLVTLEIIFMILDVTNGLTLQNPSLWRISALLISATVFANSCIWYDAYFSIRSEKKGQIICLWIIFFSNLLSFIVQLFAHGSILNKDGSIFPFVINFGVSLFILTCLVSIALKKRFCSNKE